MKKFLFAICLIAILAVPAMAMPDGLDTATTSADATVNIEQIPISLLVIDQLYFNTIIPASTDGTVTISCADLGNYTVTPGGGMPTYNGGAYPARVHIFGHPDTAFDVTLPVVPVDLVSGVDTMQLDNFNYAASSTELDTFGQAQINIGATLHIAGSQPRGDYTGSFNVTVAYD